MTPIFLRLANTAVRLWTRLYTWGLPPALRAARREDIESDLWESEHDPTRHDGVFSLPVQVFARMLFGIPDDLGWRVEQVNSMNGSLWVRIALPVGVAGVLALWLVSASTLSQPPGIPDPPRVPRRALVPPPPPPPPPPLGSSNDDAPPPVYGEASYRVHGNITPPRKIKDVRPVYPPIAVANDVHGGVVVEATIDADGRISDARVVQSIPLFDHSAINAVRQWEFEPTKVSGAPVPVVITVAVNFTRPE